MTNDNDISLLRQGVVAWNNWRKEHPEIQPILSGMNLAGLDLCEFDLRRTYFVRANLRGVKLHGAIFSGSTFGGGVVRS